MQSTVCNAPYLVLAVDEVAVVGGAVLQAKLDVKAVTIPVEGADGNCVVSHLLHLRLQAFAALPQVDARQLGWGSLA